MIKRIMVALDPDDDTPVATKYAIRLAKRFNAGITGLAVVDLSNIQVTIAVGGYGTEVFGNTVWAEMADDTRNAAEELLKEFKYLVEKAGVRHRDIKKQGASEEVIIEEMKYHDILIVGRDSHFFYNQPTKDTKTLANVVKRGDAPTLVVTEEYRDVEKIMVAFDGSSPAARTLKGFVHLLPYGKDIDIELIAVPEKDNEEATDWARANLNHAEAYLKEHGFQYINKHVLDSGNPGKNIIEHQLKKNPDLLLLGAHSVSAFKRATFGSTTHHMITNSEGALFLNS